MYLFIFILLLCLRTKTYLSPKILVCLPTDIPFHDPTCSFSYFISDWTLRSARQRFYSSAWLCLSVYFHVSSNHKNLPVTTCTRVPICIYTRSWATCSFSYLNSDKPLRSTRQRFYCAAWLCYRHASHSSNHKDLPVITATCVLSHTCTRSWPYLFIFIL